MATVINEYRIIEGKKASVSTLFKDREVLIDLIKVGFVFSIDYEEI